MQNGPAEVCVFFISLESLILGILLMCQFWCVSRTVKNWAENIFSKFFVSSLSLENLRPFLPGSIIVLFSHVKSMWDLYVSVSYRVVVENLAGINDYDPSSPVYFDFLFLAAFSLRLSISGEFVCKFTYCCKLKWY